MKSWCSCSVTTDKQPLNNRITNKKIVDSKSLLTDGLADAAGFAGGSLLAFWLGRSLGLSILDARDGNSTIFGIKLVGLGGGLSLQIARRVRIQQAAKLAKDTK